MHLTIRRTASNVSFVLAAGALALPVAVAGDDASAPQARLRTTSYVASQSRQPQLVNAAPMLDPARVGPYLPGLLMARIDGNEFAVGPVVADPLVAATSRTDTYFGVSLPPPSPWTSALATLALVVFFFMRRIV